MKAFVTFPAVLTLGLATGFWLHLPPSLECGRDPVSLKTFVTIPLPNAIDRFARKEALSLATPNLVEAPANSAAPDATAAVDKLLAIDNSPAGADHAAPAVGPSTLPEVFPPPLVRADPDNRPSDGRAYPSQTTQAAEANTLRVDKSIQSKRNDPVHEPISAPQSPKRRAGPHSDKAPVAAQKSRHNNQCPQAACYRVHFELPPILMALLGKKPRHLSSPGRNSVVGAAIAAR